MKAMNAFFVNWFASYDTVASQTTVAKLKRKRWRQNERSPVILFAFYALLTLHTSPVLAHSEYLTWILNMVRVPYKYTNNHHPTQYNIAGHINVPIYDSTKLLHGRN